METTVNHHLIRLFHIKKEELKEWEFILPGIEHAERCPDKKGGNGLFDDLLTSISLFKVCMRKYVKRKKLMYNKRK